MSLIDYFKAKIVFLFGDIHKTSSLLGFSWGTHKHKIDYSEVLEALPKIEFGDVGLHYDAGYLSNKFIPGFMKHAWIHTDDGVVNPLIVEAISEGVIQRSALYPLFSDYAIILSPKNVSLEERKGACKKVKNIIGANYDIHFKFNIDEELQFYNGNDVQGAKLDLKHGQPHLQKYDYAFSCTEAVSYAWWHKRENLNLHKKVRLGKNCIIADDFLNSGWTIKWISKSITVDKAKDKGLHEEGIQMIADYWNLNK